ncbi:unnamed protein product [Paramecium primaurelia]|uniref:Uncharacterized protein n=1 Tax=Paramecium primaurelia TaxID=5886 RepID=A0A8S1JV65_PARPR|nr:unnamed protein product [Paramecium primaurelia]
MQYPFSVSEFPTNSTSIISWIGSENFKILNKNKYFLYINTVNKYIGEQNVFIQNIYSLQQIFYRIIPNFIRVNMENKDILYQLKQIKFMNKDQSEKLCLTHNEEIIALDKEQQDKKKRGLCQQCWQCLSQERRVQVVLIKDSLKQIDEYKKIIKTDRENHLELNIKVLNSLIEELGQVKDKYLQMFELITVSIRKLIEQLQIQEQSLINKVDSINTIDIYNFYEQAKEEFKSKSLCFDDIKNDIQCKLIEMTETQKISKCIDILQNFNKIKTIFEEQFPNKDQDEINQHNLDITCDEHKEKIILVDLNKDRANQKRIACLLCVDNYSSQYKSIKYVQQEWNYIEQIRKENMNQNASFLKNKGEKFQEIFNKMKQDSQIIIEKAQKQINTNINQFFQEYKIQQKKVGQSWSKLSKEQLIHIANQLSQNDDCQLTEDLLQSEFKTKDSLIDEIVKETIQILQEAQVIAIDQTLKLLRNLQNEQKNLIKDTKQLGMESQKQIKLNCNSSQMKFDISPINYGIILQFQLEYRFCYSIAINNDLSLVLVGQGRFIYIYELKPKELKKIKCIGKHKNDVNCLNFMTLSNSFISGSRDKKIKIWKQYKDDQWKCEQILVGHTESIVCLLINNKDQMIISGSLDKTIKFWQYTEKWLCIQTITHHSGAVYGMCLNEQQNKLISCGRDKKILIIQQENNEWTVKQIIEVEICGLRICFINDTFTFQPFNHPEMHIYEFIDNQYKKTKQISIKNGSGCDILFPQKFIKQKQLLINKNGSYIHFIRVYPNSEFIVEQSIDLKTEFIYGTISNDGKYIFSWDIKQYQLQIWSQ